MSVPRIKQQMLRLAIILGVVCALSGGLLAAVYGWIGPVIEARRLEQVRSVGLDGIFPDAATFSELEFAELPAGIAAPVLEVRDAAGKVLGIWFTGENRGFGGPVKMAVGVDPAAQSLVGVRVLEHQETPGLGSPIEEAAFLDPLAGKALSDPFQIGVDVAGLTGATVSSRAVYEGASRMAREVLAELGVEVEPPAPVEPAASAGPTVGPARPAYADRVEEIMGREGLTFAPGDVWEVSGDDGTVAGIAAVITVRGFEAPIDVLVVVDPADAVVRGVRILRQSETPGLGTQITSPGFLQQFAGKGPGDAYQVGSDVDGLTMATISAQAVADAVRIAVSVVGNLY